MLLRVSPEIPVDDLPHSIEYYEQMLGFRLTMQMEDGSYAIVARDGVAIHLYQDAAKAHSRASMHILTNQIELLLAEFERRGALVIQGIIRKPWGNRDFRVNDDSGNELKFTEPLPDDE